MSNKFIEKFKNNFNFLEQYGFVFSKDPYNPERPCYKNYYGEIIMWIKEESGFFSTNPILYVQVNGWKTEIDVIKEYKKYISKVTIFKSYEYLFKKLFEYMVEHNNYDFYGIKVFKNLNSLGLLKKYEVSIADFNTSYNPLDEIKRSRISDISLVTIFILIFAQLFAFAFGFEYIKSRSFMFVMQNISCGIMFVVNILTMILLFNKINKISKILLIIYPIIITMALHMFDRRTDYSIYFYVFLVYFLYFLFYVIKAIINKKAYISLEGIIVFIYPLFTSTAKLFMLFDYLFFDEGNLLPFILVGLVISIIFMVLYIILIKCKSDKKEYIGGLLASFFVPFAVITFIPYFISCSINYVFDTSIGDENQYQIIEKNIGRSTGRYSSRLYRLVIIKDGAEEMITVNSLVYYEYEIGEYITLVYHDGFIGMEYYEYEE